MLKLVSVAPLATVSAPVELSSRAIRSARLLYQPEPEPVIVAWPFAPLLYPRNPLEVWIELPPLTRIDPVPDCPRMRLVDELIEAGFVGFVSPFNVTPA